MTTNEINVIASLLGGYGFINMLVLIVVFFDHEKIFKNGFLVKHLILSILFLPATLIYLFALLVIAIIVKIDKITKHVINKKNVQKFLNRRLF